MTQLPFLPRAARRWRGTLPGFALAFGLGMARPAEVRIDEAVVRPEGTLEVHFEADPQSYYRLLRGIEVTAVGAPVAIGFHGPLTAPAGDGTVFARLEQLERGRSLDTDGDGLPDVYELERPAFDPLQPGDGGQDFDGDGRSNLAEFLAGTDPLSPDPRLTTLASSPRSGDDGVAVTRETVLTFTRPLATDTVLTGSRLFAEAVGRRVLTRAELSPDRRRATLFYLEPLPGGVRVRVTFDGTTVQDDTGRTVDADGDGVEGGVARIEFDTLSNRPVPGTAVLGRVFASELVPGAGPGTNAINRPLPGAIITVDGMEESLRAVTDADGNFTLTNAPAGRFFVHVDGRTAEGSHWPDGNFYPYVGKAWEAVAGRLDNRAGGTGEIYLPLIRSGTLKPVSTRGPTYVTFPAEVLADLPVLEGVGLMVPANSLYDDGGVRGGRVGLAPVAPDRLPEALPDGLRFPLVITVQTDGPRNFAEPVPVCFPNLPDPVTGEKLPPGAKSALWSFDHDKGYWEVVGPMTVSADGRLVCCDDGVGILQPGWHGALPGASGSGGNSRQSKTRCAATILGPGSTYTNRWVTLTTTTATQGGIWAWTAPGAEPASGMGPEFQLRYQREGTHHIHVRYTTPNGKTQCDAEHTIKVTRLPCEIAITGPAKVPLGTLMTYRAAGEPAGGKYLWRVGADGQIDDPKAAEVQVFWAKQGDQELTLEYTANPGTPDEQKCEATRTITVTESLRILDAFFREVNAATEVQKDEELLWEGNLSDTAGDYTWSGSAGTLFDDPTGRIPAITFTHTGLQSVTVNYVPQDPELPRQTRTVTVRVRSVCSVLVPDSIRQDIPPNTPITFEAITDPATGGTVRWQAPGGTPITGIGRQFTTEYATTGPKHLTVTYTNPSGDTCDEVADVHIGPVNCQVTVSGPGSLSVVEGAIYQARGNGGSAETFVASVVETGDILGAGGGGGTFRFLFAPAFLSPGNYTLRVVYNALYHDLFLGECTATFPVTVRAPNFKRGRTGVALQDAGEPDDTEPAPGRHLFLRTNLRHGGATRGTTAPNGVVHPVPVRLPANTPFRTQLLDSSTFMIASADFITPGDGAAFTFPDFLFQPDLSRDTDGDGLSDQAEAIVGSNPALPDTDGDGVNDAAEVRAGTSPTGAEGLGPGLVGTVGVGGYAWDVGLAGRRALVAAGPAGLAVFNVFDPRRPVLIGQADTPGEARGVAVAGEYAAVADGPAGLALVDLRDAPNLTVRHQVPLGAAVTAVAAGNQVVYAGLATGALVIIDPATGRELGRRDLEGSIEDLAVQGRWVFALTWRQEAMRVTVLEAEEGGLGVRNELGLNGRQGAGDRRLRLVAAGDRLYAVFTQGYAVINLTRPNEAFLIREVVTGQAGWRHFGLNAGGLLVAATDAVSTDEGAHDLQLHRLGADGTTPVFELTLPTPGSAEAVALEGNLAWVADGAAGLHVYRYQDEDRARLAPSVEVRAPGGTGTIEENRPVTLVAVAVDDVGVDRVEFLVDGILVDTDAQFPFEMTLTAPPRAPDRDRISITARAIDTGGNVGTSVPLVLTLRADTTAPQFAGTLPDGGQEIAGTPISSVLVRLSEPVDPDSVTAANFTLVAAGPDGQFDTADDLELSGRIVHQVAEQRVWLQFAGPLDTGRYRATIGPGLRDPLGNTNPGTHQWNFRIIGPKVIGSLPTSYGSSAGYAGRVRFSRAMDPDSTRRALRIFMAGPDGSPDTEDDVPAPFNLRFEAGGTEAVVTFEPVLAAGQYFIRVDAAATDLAGRRMHEPWDTYFLVQPIDFGEGMSIGGNTGEMNTGQEYRIHFDGPVDLAIANQQPNTVVLSRPDGTVLATSGAAVFRVRIPAAGDYQLRIARTENGQSSTIQVQLRTSTEATFTHDLTGQANALLTGRAQLAPGETDHHLITLEPGRAYSFMPDADADTACRLQWSIYGPDGTPWLLNSRRCYDPFTVRLETGGAVRIQLDAAGSVVAPRIQATRL